MVQKAIKHIINKLNHFPLQPLASYFFILSIISSNSLPMRALISSESFSENHLLERESYWISTYSIDELNINFQHYLFESCFNVFILQVLYQLHSIQRKGNFTMVSKSVIAILRTPQGFITLCHFCIRFSHLLQKSALEHVRGTQIKTFFYKWNNLKQIMGNKTVLIKGIP